MDITEYYKNLKNVIKSPEMMMIANWPDYLASADLAKLTNLYPNILTAAKESPTDLAEVINNRAQEIGAVIYILEKDSSIKYVTNDFYLSGVQFAMKERVQILEAFEGVNINFFDESTKVYTFSGVVLEQESSDINRPYKYFQQSSLIKMYNDVLRGTKLVERGAIGVLKVKNHLIYGYPFQFQSQMNSNIDKVANFVLGWIVIDHKMAYPGIVTENELTSMFTKSNQLLTSNYLDEINTSLNLINKIIDFSTWPTDNSDIKSLLNNLMVTNFGSLSYNAIKNLPNLKLFKETLITNLKNYKEHIMTYFNDKDKVSPILTRYYTKDNINLEFDNIILSIQSMDKSPDDFVGLGFFIKKLIILKNDLLTYQARLVY
jgi:hypothetical protein